MELVVDGEVRTLHAQPATAGARYRGPGYAWWTQGVDEGLLMRLGPDAEEPALWVACTAKVEKP